MERGASLVSVIPVRLHPGTPARLHLAKTTIRPERPGNPEPDQPAEGSHLPVDPPHGRAVQLSRSIRCDAPGTIGSIITPAHVPLSLRIWLPHLCRWGHPAGNHPPKAGIDGLVDHIYPRWSCSLRRHHPMGMGVQPANLYTDDDRMQPVDLELSPDDL